MSSRITHPAFRICFIVPGFPADEDDWFTPAVAETILAMRERYNVYVISLQYPEMRSDYRIQGMPVSAIGKKGIGAVKEGVNRITDEHRRKPFDLIHAFWATVPGITGAIASWKTGVPLIVTCAGGELVNREDLDYGDWRSFLPFFCVQAAMRKSDRIIVGSHYQKMLVNGRNASWGAKTSVIPLGIDTEHFQPGVIHKENEVITILHVAGLVRIKNQHLLLQALARIKDRHWRLGMVGDGPLKESLQDLSRTLGIDDRITWHGWIHHDEIVACYQQADLFVLTSEHEAQGVVLLDAMACGLPVVTTEVGLAPELIEDCVARGDEQALTNAISDFIDDPEKRRIIGHRNRKVAEQYDMMRMVERLSEVYESVLSDSTWGAADI